MAEALVTALGLLLGTVAALVSLFSDDRAAAARKALLVLAILGLLAGGYTTYLQYQSRKAADTDARTARTDLSKIKDKVGDVAILDTQIQTKMDDLTALDKLGDAHYYVVIDTFKEGSPADDKDFASTKGKLDALFPDAEKNSMLWTKDVGNQHYQLRFGRNLSLSSAQIFLGLANQGLASGNALIRRE